MYCTVQAIKLFAREVLVVTAEATEATMRSFIIKAHQTQMRWLALGTASELPADSAARAYTGSLRASWRARGSLPAGIARKPEPQAPQPSPKCSTQWQIKTTNLMGASWLERSEI